MGNQTKSTFLKSNIITHFESERHIIAIQDSLLNNSLLNKLKNLKYNEFNEVEEEIKLSEDPTITLPEEESSLEEKDALKLEFTISKFIIDHQLSYSLSKDLLELIKSISANFHPEIVNGSSIDRNKT